MGTVRYTSIDGEILAEKRSGVRRTYVPDPLGSTTALAGSTQALTDTFAYWPYGEERYHTGPTPTPFRYVGTRGYYRDSSTVAYVRARSLTVQFGRWLNSDPWESDSSGTNLYPYVDNNPTTIVDPSGLVGILCFLPKDVATCKTFCTTTKRTYVKCTYDTFPGLIGYVVTCWCVRTTPPGGGKLKRPRVKKFRQPRPPAPKRPPFQQRCNECGPACFEKWLTPGVVPDDATNTVMFAICVVICLETGVVM